VQCFWCPLLARGISGDEIRGMSIYQAPDLGSSIAPDKESIAPDKESIAPIKNPLLSIKSP